MTYKISTKIKDEDIYLNIITFLRTIKAFSIQKEIKILFHRLNIVLSLMWGFLFLFERKDSFHK